MSCRNPFALILGALFSVLALVAPASAGGPITSGQSVTGTIAGPSFAESWTFNGTIGDRVVLSAGPTSGTLVTQIRMLNPSNAEVVNTGATITDYKLLASGTYTITIQDNQLNKAGTYSLTMLDVTSGPLTSAGDTDGGAIASASVVAGQVNATSDLDAFTFSGTAGDRVLIGAVATAGVSFNTSITVYPPNGGAAEQLSSSGDRLDAQLQSTGTYTIVVSDYFTAHPGSYSLSFLNVSKGPWTTGADLDGGPIVSSEVRSGTFSAPPDFDGWTFTGTAGDRVVITTATTGGSSTAYVSVYPPGGGAPLTATANNRADIQLPSTGTYVIEVEDNGLNDTGTYDLSFVDITSGPWTTAADADGTTLLPGQAKSGTIGSDVDMDVFTFVATAGDRVELGGVSTGGAGFNTNLTLYPPGGGPAEVTTSSGDRIDWRVLRSGIYTVEVEDYSVLHPGTYTLSFVDLTTGVVTTPTDPDGDAIGSGQHVSGGFQEVPDFDVWRVSATAGNRLLLDVVPTAGNANPVIELYPPDGTAAVITSASHRAEWQVNQTGTWTVVLSDQGLNDTGSYDFTVMNVTAGPITAGGDPEGGAITSATPVSGSIQYDVDMDAYTFSGTQGDRIVLGAIALSGASFNTTMTLYPPGGGPAEITSSSGDRLDAQLQATGTYTVVVEDYFNAHPGTYSLLLMNTTAGPLTSAGDADGTTIASAEIKPGSFQTAPDFDAYRFTCNAGNRMIFDVVPVGGAASNPVLNIYPPGGGPTLVTSASHRVEWQAPSSGTYTLLLEDQGLNDTGTYDLTLLNLSAGPLTTVADPDGGALAAATTVAGQMDADVDLDAFTFNGSAGDQVLFGAVRTGATTLNTTLTLYPPQGGPYEALSSSADRLEATLLQSGTYTIVVEDYGNTHTGAYNLSFVDLTRGPLTSAGDTDGGVIVTGDTKLGQFQATPDFDVYRFAGAIGDTVRLTTATISGTNVPQVFIYGPYGAYLYTSLSTTPQFVVPATANYSLVLQDQTLANTGGYSVHFTKTGGPVGTQDTPAALALAPAVPNPSTGAATLAFTLPGTRDVVLALYDVHGKLVRTLASGRYAGGRSAVRWDGRDAHGALAPSGVYWAELTAGKESMRTRLVHLP